MSAMNTTPTLGDLPTEEELDFALDIKRRAKSGERVPESDLDRALGIKRRAKAYRAAGAKPVEPSAVLPDNLSPNPDFYTQHMQNVNRGPLDVASAAPAIPAPPPGWRQGVDALNFGDIPILGPAQRLVQAATETEGERLARQYATPQLSGVAGFGTKVARMAGGVMDPGGAAVGTSANILEQGGSPIEAAFGGGVAALSNFARVPGAEKLGQFATGALSRSAPDVVRRGVGLAAQGAAAGIGLGEAQALAEGVAAVPRGIGQQAEAGNPDPIRAAITDEVNRLVAAQPDILASGALGGVVAEGVMRGLGRAFQGRQSRQARPAEGAMPGAGRPEALGETSLRSPRPQPTDGQSLPLESNALPQTPTGEVRSRDAQTGSSETAPRELLSWASSEVPGTAAFPRTPEVPAETSPRAGMAADRTSNNASASQAESRPSPDPIRSGDTLAEGSTVADAKGNTFTVGATLGNGKTVVRAENGKTLRLTAGEMEARGWRRESVSQTLIGDKSQNPSDGRPDSPHTSIPDTKSQDLNQAGSKKQLQSRVDGDLVRASPDRTPPQDVSPNATNHVAEAAPAADAPGYLDRVVAWAEAKSRAGRTPRPADRAGMRFGGTEINVYDVIAAAVKAVRAGVRTAKAVRDIVREHLGKDDEATALRTWRLVRDSQTADGTHDDARMEANIADLLARDVRVNTTLVREQTGQTASEPKGEKQPWEMTRGEYLDSQRTGHIESDAYDRYRTSEGLSFVRPEQYAEQVGTVTVNGKEVELRKNTRPVQYVKKDSNGEIVRGENGLAVMLTSDEAKQKGLQTIDGGIGAFVDGKPVGFASNEFGTTGVWVVETMRGDGLGKRLIRELHKTNPELASRAMGQMTSEGVGLVKSYHKDLVRNAVSEGRNIPAEVLKDYPDLAPRPAKSPPATPEVAPPDAAQTPRKGPTAPEAPAVEPAPTERPKADAPGYLDRVVAWAEAKSRAGRTPRPADRAGMRFGGTEINVYDVIAAAAKAVRAGVRTAKAVRDIVPEHLGRDDDAVARRAWGLVRDSQTADGTHDDARMEANIADLLARDVRVNTKLVREQTGQTASEPKTITQAAALKGRLKAEERGANRATKDAEVVRKAQEKRDARRVQAAVGLERGAAEQSAQIQAGLAEQRTERKLSAQAEKFKAERQAMREKFADVMDTERAKAAVGQDIRARLVQVARENLDHADVRKVMAFIAKARAKNPVTKTRPDGTTITDPVTRDFYAGLKRILDVADRSAARQSIKSLKGTTGTERTENPQTIGAALFNALHKNTPESKFRKNRIDDTEVSKLRTEYRDVLAPVVDAVRNGYADKTDALADFIQKQVDEGRSNAMTPEDLSVLKGTKGKLIDEMSTRERTVLENAIRHTAYLSDKANEVQVLGERHDLLKLRDRAAQEITDFTKNAEAWNPSESERLGEKARAVVQWVKDFLTSTQDSLSTLAGKLGGMGSALHDTVYRSVARAESKAITTEREALKASGLEGVTPARIARLNRKQTIRIGGKDFRLTPAEMIDLIGSWNDPSTRAEIEKAGVVLESDAARADRTFFVGDDFIRMVESALRPEDRALLNSMQKAMNDTYQLANDAHERMHGYRLPDTDNHWSRVRAREQTERGDSSEMEARLRGSRAFEDSGIFKDRSTTNAPVVVRNPLEWVPDQIHTLAGMAHLAEPMRAARRLIDGPAVKAAIEKAGGKGMARTMNQRLAELVQSPYADPEGINGFLSKLVNFSARQKLAFRITTVAKQRLGLLQAATAARDAGLAAKLTGKILDPSTWSPAKRNRLRAEIEPRSGYLAQRADPAFAATIASAANPKLKVAASKIGRAIQGVERVGLSGLQFADADVVLGTYDTVKNHLAESKGLTGDALVDAAVTKTEEIIRESQNPTSMLDMSGAQLAGRRNALWGAYTLFSSSSNKLRNLLRQSYFEYQADKTPQNLRKLATATALAGTNAVLSRSIGLLLGGVMVRSIVSSIGGDTADEKKPKTASDFAVGAFAELADSVLPGGGNALRVFKGGSAGGQSWLESVVAQGASVAKAFENPTKRPLDKAAAVLRAARVLGVAPDAVLDYTTAIVEGIAGPEPAGWSVKAALDRGDQKAAIRRGSEYITLRAKKDPEKDRDENLLDAKETLRASILAAMNKDVAKDDVDTRATNGELADRIAEEAYSLAR